MTGPKLLLVVGLGRGSRTRPRHATLDDGLAGDLLEGRDPVAATRSGDRGRGDWPRVLLHRALWDTRCRRWSYRSARTRRLRGVVGALEPGAGIAGSAEGWGCPVGGCHYAGALSACMNTVSMIGLRAG